MSRRVEVQRIDDLDGSEANRTIRFVIHGVAYEMDLNESNAAEFEAVMGRYVAVARRLGSSLSHGKAHDMRAWAISKGMSVSRRGRVSADVIEAYLLAHRSL